MTNKEKLQKLADDSPFDWSGRWSNFALGDGRHLTLDEVINSNNDVWINNAIVALEQIIKLNNGDTKPDYEW